ncbi:MAG TPA: hypothetical protein PKG95_07880 [Anaerolineaceae bacterium]|nr:hypothetical protein [Anaerolineaceae bacterium]
MRKFISLLLPLSLILILALTACTPTSNPTSLPADIRTAYPGLPLAGSVPTPDYAAPQTYLTARQADLVPPTEAPTPDAGMASLSGLLYVPREELILAATQFYLCAAEGENLDQLPSIQVVGGIASRGDIVAVTNEKGEFFLNNIPPGNYFLIVSPPNNVIISVNSTADKTPLLIKLSADQQLPLGVVIVPTN